MGWEIWQLGTSDHHPLVPNSHAPSASTVRSGPGHASFSLHCQVGAGPHSLPPDQLNGAGPCPLPRPPHHVAESARPCLLLPVELELGLAMSPSPHRVKLEPSHAPFPCRAGSVWAAPQTPPSGQMGPCHAHPRCWIKATSYIWPHGWIRHCPSSWTRQMVEHHCLKAWVVVVISELLFFFYLVSVESKIES